MYDTDDFTIKKKKLGGTIPSFFFYIYCVRQVAEVSKKSMFVYNDMIIYTSMTPTMIRDPELSREEAPRLDPTKVILPAREGREIRYAWDAPAYLEHERGRNWYIAMGIIVFLLVLYGWFSGSVMMSLAVLIFAWVYIRVHTTVLPSTMIRTILSDRGVIHGNAFYEYSNITGFSFIYGADYMMLTLDIHKRFSINPNIYLTGLEDIEEIRRILSEKSEEITDVNESLLHRLFRILKL